MTSSIRQAVVRHRDGGARCIVRRKFIVIGGGGGVLYFVNLS